MNIVDTNKEQIAGSATEQRGTKVGLNGTANVGSWLVPLVVLLAICAAGFFIMDGRKETQPSAAPSQKPKAGETTPIQESNQAPPSGTSQYEPAK